MNYNNTTAIAIPLTENDLKSSLLPAQYSTIENVQSINNRATIVAPPLKSFSKKYIFSIKNCLFYAIKYKLEKNSHLWKLTKYKKKEIEEYQFNVNDSDHLFNLCSKLGMIDQIYKITLRNSKNRKISSYVCDGLLDGIIWCFNTEIELANVEHLHSSQ